jgi:hypothetical protein
MELLRTSLAVRTTLRVIQGRALIAAQLLFAGLQAGVVAGVYQAFARRCRPGAVGAQLCQRVAHRGQLVPDRPTNVVVDLRVIELAACDQEEVASDRGTRWSAVAPRAARDQRDGQSRYRDVPSPYAHRP